jgi:hypothetical protein
MVVMWEENVRKTKSTGIQLASSLLSLSFVSSLLKQDER